MGLFDQYSALVRAFRDIGADGDNPFTLQFDRVVSATEAELAGRRIVMFGANNYLGLTFDPDCIAAAVAATRAEGTGTTGSRIANGTYSGHAALERELATFLGLKHVIVCSTGFQANLAALATLAGPGDTIVLDRDAHASLYDGAALSGATLARFRHNNMSDLDARLSALDGHTGNRIIVVEGLYSMMGDNSPLREIADIKNRHDACLIVDEAHALGVCGPTGRGAAEQDDVVRDVDVMIGTFSKSLGAVGGFAASAAPEFAAMRVAFRPYMFSASLPPAIVASVRAALEALQAKPALRVKLWRNARLLYESLTAIGFALGPMVGPIVAIKIEHRDSAVKLWRELLARGFDVNLALPPATPNGLSMLRCSVTAAHTSDQIESFVHALIALTRAPAIEPADTRFKG